MSKIELAKRPAESNYAHHKRIIQGKLGDKTLSDIDYSELALYAYGKPYSSDVARRMFYGSKYTLDLLNDEKVEEIKGFDIISEIDGKVIELKKEQQKFYDQRNAFNKLVRERSRQEELNEIIINAIPL